MSLLLDLIARTEGGGSRFGIHFLKDWDRCEWYAFSRYLAEHPEGYGLTPVHKARPLLVGGGVHHALEPWYRSRCINPSTGQWTEDHGNADLDRARHDLTTWQAQHAEEWEDEQERETDCQLMLDYLVRYHDWYGPKGVSPEWPDTRVFVDGSGPWIEREIEVDLDWRGLVFTCRIDLIATFKTSLCIYETKTTSASGFFSLLRRMHMDAQPTAELFSLRHARTDKPGVLPSACIINAINKNPAQSGRGKTPPFGRERITRTDEDMAKFQIDVIHSLERIEDMLGRWKQLTDSGVESYEAALRIFRKSGSIVGACYDYNRACDYWGMCTNTGREAASALAFRPRIRREEATA